MIFQRYLSHVRFTKLDISLFEVFMFHILCILSSLNNQFLQFFSLLFKLRFVVDVFDTKAVSVGENFDSIKIFDPIVDKILLILYNNDCVLFFQLEVIS